MQFINSYHALGNAFYAECDPMPAKAPELFIWNPDVADFLGIDQAMQADEALLARYFSGSEILPDAKPLAMAYSGHQFGQFNPQLGDGRAHLLGDVLSEHGTPFDIQLKGAGRTPFSRGGDGRCAFKPALREFIMSEAMAALGVPTTRCLAVVITGEHVFREEALPGAVVTRVASSHLRVGTFEFFRARNLLPEIKTLADYAIQRHYAELASLPEEERYLAFLNAVIENQIELICQWMRVGFIHGVMNTDNTTISGETIDYGPCAMVSQYNPHTVFSSIDAQGRYRFGNQAAIAQWNMARFAECLLPLLDSDDQAAIAKATETIQGFKVKYAQAYTRMMGKKLGLTDTQDDDKTLIDNLLQVMQDKAMDYTQTFDLLTRSFNSVAIASEMQTELGDWFPAWQSRLEKQNTPKDETAALMRQQNPVVIPRNHHVEAVLESCQQSGSANAAYAFLKVLRSPYEVLAETAQFQDAPEDADRSYRTFCGT